MYTRAERIAQISLVVVGGFVLGRGGGGSGTGSDATPSASGSPKPPDVTFTQDTCCTQTARFLKAAWTSTDRVTTAKVVVTPETGFPCDTTLDPSGLKGVISCQGLLKGATDYVAALTLTGPRGTFSYP